MKNSHIVFVGNLTPQEGSDILWEALRLLEERGDLPDQITLYIPQEEVSSKEASRWRTLAGLSIHEQPSPAEIADILAGATLVVPARWPSPLSPWITHALSQERRVIAFQEGGIVHLESPYLTKVEEISAKSLAAAISNLNKTTTSHPKVGFLSTWNQPCGLAEMGRYLVRALEKDRVVILSEESVQSLTSEEKEGFTVLPCWKRGHPEYTRLQEAIKSQKCEVLHCNIHPRFFVFPQFKEVLQTIRAQGCAVVLHIHSTFGRDEALAQFAEVADHVICHSPQNRFEVIAHRISPTKVSVVPHGVRYEGSPSSHEKEALKQSLGFNPAKKLLVTCGFLQPHKGMEALVEAVEMLKRQGEEVQGVIVGSSRSDDPSSVQYKRLLERMIQERGVSSIIQLREGFVPEEELIKYFKASDCVLLNYHSTHYESSGVAALAVGVGARVAASQAPAFHYLGEALWRATSGVTIDRAAALIITHPALAEDLQKKALNKAHELSWNRVVGKMKQLYKEVRSSFESDVGKEKENAMEWNRLEKKMRVLFQNRPTAHQYPGGDTVVMDRYSSLLRQRGIDVVIDNEGKEDPRSFDVVHLFNFALPDILKSNAERAFNAGVPFVVTTLCEDVPQFHSQSHVVAEALISYQQGGQEKNKCPTFSSLIDGVIPTKRFENSWVVQHAAALLTNGLRESAVLRKDYGQLNNIKEILLGFDQPKAVTGNLFSQQFNIQDFILVVGRLESRKNQLMLLKALEDSELPIVFAGGGFSYQPEYEQAVRKFRRKGTTIVTGRLSDELLASAYAACKVHVLPSWYELPGLVSLEAAWHGKNVVVTDRGTAYDYLGELAFYAEPHDERSLRNAVIAAYYSPVLPALRQQVLHYSWKASIDALITVYQQVQRKEESPTSNRSEAVTALKPSWSLPELPKGITFGKIPDFSQGNKILGSNHQPDSSASPSLPRMVEASSTQKPQEQVTQDNSSEVMSLIIKGEEFARQGKYEESLQCLIEAEGKDPRAGRALKGQGAVHLAQGNVAQARVAFEKTIQVNSKDTKALTGLGICSVREKAYEKAHAQLLESLDINPDQTVALLNLIECAYYLNSFAGLTRALTKYIERNPNDHEMKFCLAGSYFKEERYEEALELVRQVKAKDPSHQGAGQLDELIGKELSKRHEHAKSPFVSPLNASVVQEKTALPSQEPVRQTFAPVDSTEMEFSRLEEEKLHRNFETVLRGCDAILSRVFLKPEQKEKALLLKAEVELLSQRIETSEKLFHQVLEANSSSARALAGKGRVCLLRNDRVNALEYFDRALSSDPCCDGAHIGRALCLQQTGKLQEAWNSCRNGLLTNPENQEGLSLLIELGESLGLQDQVEENLLAYLDMHPADLERVCSLAHCYFAQRKIEQAVRELEKIALFKPDHEGAKLLRSKMEDSLRRAV